MDPTAKLREEAWIGDAVLALFARTWLLKHVPEKKNARASLFELFTSNQFLSSSGEPTQVEAEIGRIYLQSGLTAAFAHLEANLLQRFIPTARNRGYEI
jgi:hypothetical protein